MGRWPGNTPCSMRTGTIPSWAPALAPWAPWTRAPSVDGAPNIAFALEMAYTAGRREATCHWGGGGYRISIRLGNHDSKRMEHRGGQDRSRPYTLMGQSDGNGGLRRHTTQAPAYPAHPKMGRQRGRGASCPKARRARCGHRYGFDRPGSGHAPGGPSRGNRQHDRGR